MLETIKNGMAGAIVFVKKFIDEYYDIIRVVALAAGIIAVIVGLIRKIVKR